MRVVHVTSAYAPAFEWGGPVRSVEGLVTGLAAEGHDVLVVTTTRRMGADLPPIPPGERRRDQVRVQYFDVRWPKGFGLSGGLARALVRACRNADVVHGHGLWTFPQLAASRSAGWMARPYVLSPRGMLQEWALQHRVLKKRLYLALVERGSLRGASCVHCTSPAELDAVRRVCPSAEAVVVPNPLRAEAFAEPSAPEELPNQELRLLMLGRVHPVKGFDVLVPAMSRALAQGLRFHLRIAGVDEGGYRAVVEGWVANAGLSGRCTWLGVLEPEQVRRELGEAHLLVMPSHQENFGMSAAEAMAVGRPVVVSDQVGLAGYVEDHEAGLVVPLDAAALAEALMRLAKAPGLRGRMGRNGRRVAEEHFSARGVARRMVSHYEDAIRRQGRSRR